MSSESFIYPKYRPDIDGLRAIAVLAVVAYHAFPDFMRAGFVGVDIFFVISGFLISTILFENLKNGTFHFSTFYARRIRRIFPALLTVVISCYLFGWFVLIGNEFMQLGKYTAASSVFLSNVALWRSFGYFDTVAAAKPLLHLWSLGIEEQFYIIWPLVLWIVWKWKKVLLPLLLLAALGSLFWNGLRVHGDPSGTFYLPWTRFWELLCGSLLAWNSVFSEPFSWQVAASSRSSDRDRISTGFQRFVPHGICSVAVILLLVGLSCITKELAYPGYWALLPVLAAALTIYAGPSAWFNRYILSRRVLVWIGLISYPLYLWHWPLLSFARILLGRTLAFGVCLTLVLLSVLLAWITYRLVEHPVRTGGHIPFKVSLLVVLMAASGGIGFLTYCERGFEFRSVARNTLTPSSGLDASPIPYAVQGCGLKDPSLEAKLPYCIHDSRGNVRYALLGDSKAIAMYPGLFRTAAEGGRWIFMGGTGEVTGNADILRPSSNSVLRDVKAAAFQGLLENHEIQSVVYVAATRALFGKVSETSIVGLASDAKSEISFRELKGSIAQLVGSGKKVVLVVDNPTLPYPEDCLNRAIALPLLSRIVNRNKQQCSISMPRQKQLSAPYREFLGALKVAFPGSVQIFDSTGYLCDTQSGLCGYVRDGKYLYSYTDHISDFAAGLIGKDLNQFLARH